jgi:hypothetical protein
MRHRAVLFDLFGTLVPCYPLAALGTVIRDMAEELGLPAERFAAEWARTFPLRRWQAFASVEQNIERVLESLGLTCPREHVLVAARRRMRFEASTLCPRSISRLLQRWRSIRSSACSSAMAADDSNGGRGGHRLPVTRCVRHSEQAGIAPAHALGKAGASKRESLQRKEREARPRCRSRCRYESARPEGGGPIEWRRRESNPRPKMISDGFYVT